MTSLQDLTAIVEQQQQVISTLNQTIAAMRADIAQNVAATQAATAAATAAAASSTPVAPPSHASRSNAKFGKELCPDSFGGDGTEKGGFRSWSQKASIYLSIDRTGVLEILRWAGAQTAEITSNEYKDFAEQRSLCGDQGRDHTLFSADLYTFLFLSLIHI